jgi:hypothetical protein
MRSAGATRDGGFILVDALVGLVVFAAAATVIYEIGIELLARSDRDLDHLSALTALHTEAKVLQALGHPAEELFPSQDANFSYQFSASPKEEMRADGTPLGFSWADIVAVDRRTKSEVARLTVGFDD